MRLSIPLGFLVFLNGLPCAWAQRAAFFETNVEVVRLGVTVTRGGDRFVTGLQAKSFRILEDNVPQEVRLFSRRSAPLTLVLLLDVSSSMTDRLPHVQEAASRFVRALDPDDVVQVAQFKDRVTVLQEFTSDKALLETAIARTQAFGATALHNALYGAIRTLNHTRHPDEMRRQAIVVLSDGEDTASVVSEDQVLDFARRSEVAIYGIGLDPDMKDRSAPTPALKLLTSLTRETGGTLLLPSSLNDLEGTYESIAEELRTQYTLGYAPTNAIRDGRWRRIDIKIEGVRGLELRHRLGYYATGRSRRAQAGRPAPGLPLATAAADEVTRSGPTAGGAVERIAQRTGVAAEDARSTPTGIPVAAEGAELSEWMDLQEGVLRMRLARQGEGKVEYGVLRADTTSRTLAWEIGAGEPAAGGSLELSFDDVGSVSACKRAGFLVEPRPGHGPAWLLMPAPYGSWLAEEGLRSSDLPREVLVDTRLAVTGLLEALGRAPAAGQAALYAFFGTPVSVALADLFESPAEYEGKAVRVRGEFELVSQEHGLYGLFPGSRTVDASENLEYSLDLDPTEEASIEITPVYEVAAFVGSHAKSWEGQQVDIVGVFRRGGVQAARQGHDPGFRVRFWAVSPSGQEAAGPALIGRPTTLADLAAANGQLDGELVRVIGRFRGQNIYGDLPNASRQGGTEWVIKDGPHAAWVTGKAAAGTGWRLDPQNAKDCVNWLQVAGRPRTKDGFVYLRAVDVVPSVAPSPHAMPEPTRTQIRTYGPPVITFALPEADEQIVPDTQFVIQFSNPMDPASIQGHVKLEYANHRPGERDFEWLRVTYSDHSRHIVIDPGRPLHSGRLLQCRLLPGIVDADGRPLNARPGREGEGVVEVLQFEVGK